MLLLQFGIGAANDWADAAADATARPAKPIPAGLVRRSTAARIAVAAAAAGLALAMLAGLPAARRRRRRPRHGARLRPASQADPLVVAAVRGRDPAAPRLRLDRRNRVRCLPSFAVLVPIAMVAGAALAVANAVADVEGDLSRRDRDGRDEPRARPGAPHRRRARGPGCPGCPLVSRAPRRRRGLARRDSGRVDRRPRRARARLERPTDHAPPRLGGPGRRARARSGGLARRARVGRPPGRVGDPGGSSVSPRDRGRR